MFFLLQLLSCKKGCSPIQKVRVKKVVKYRLQPKIGCYGRPVEKNLTTMIQVNLCCFIPTSLGISSPDIIIKFFIDLSSQLFLGRHFYFTTFFTLDFLQRAIPFFTAWLFSSGLFIQLHPCMLKSPDRQEVCYSWGYDVQTCPLRMLFLIYFVCSH